MQKRLLRVHAGHEWTRTLTPCCAGSSRVSLPLLKAAWHRGYQRHCDADAAAVLAAHPEHVGDDSAF